MDEFTEILKKTGITEEHQDKPDARVDLEKKFESLIYAVKFLPVIIVAILLTVYFSEFNGEFGDQSTFGAFGDFLGGVLNPILTFLATLLLITSIKIQIDELSEARRELKETKQVHEEAVMSQERQAVFPPMLAKLKQIEEELVELLNAPFVGPDLQERLKHSAACRALMQNKKCRITRLPVTFNVIKNYQNGAHQPFDQTLRQFSMFISKIEETRLRIQYTQGLQLHIHKLCDLLGRVVMVDKELSRLKVASILYRDELATPLRYLNVEPQYLILVDDDVEYKALSLLIKTISEKVSRMEVF